MAALNLCAAPFDLPSPALIIREGDSDATYGDKSLGLWKIADLLGYR